ncbi:hypothetical protein ACWDBO_46145 [Streptomyces mirabilis]|uniref:hypothetical protein n=1 Tax=Streptomyces TaxID=1883 RepID=UPI0029AA85EA|nr:hypothetical protein [Streptomyces sp. AK02-04a]MDX3762978.1 hypothetical protein [Streptomyces sp. AK02-04a]
MGEAEGPQSRTLSDIVGAPGCCLWWTVLAVLSAMTCGLLLVLGQKGPGDSGGGTQKAYVEEIDQARQQLFTGQLVHTDARYMGLVAGAEPSPFQVEVLGRWRQARPGEAQAPVSAGAQIGVKLRCSGVGVRCIPLSSERQNVLSKRDGATWMWDVSAQHAGKISIALTVTAYFRDSDTVLVEKPPVTTHVDVAAPPSDNGWLSWAKELWQWVTGAVTSLGGLAVSVSTIVALVVMVVRRQPPGADADDTATTEGDGDGPRPRARPVRESRAGLSGGRPRTRSTAGRSTRSGRPPRS